MQKINTPTKRIKRTVDKEQYYTSSALAKNCISRVDLHFPLSKFSMIVEPSAGTGAFLHEFPAGYNTVGLDIDPKAKDILNVNFFDWTPAVESDNILVIGNPPFGQRGSLAVKFINHAAKFADTIAFILPRSFNKYTFLNRVPTNFHLIDSFECDDFVLENGNSVKVKCVFQLWKKSDTPRIVIKSKSEHPDFLLCHCHLSRTSDEKLKLVLDKYPWSIPQVGANLKIKPSNEVKSGSHWFIKPLNDSVTSTLAKMDFRFLEGMNTAFMSLSKNDIIKAYDLVVRSDEYIG